MRIIRLLRLAALAASIAGLASLAAPATAPTTTPHAEIRSNYIGAEPLHGAELAGFKTRSGGTEVSI